MLKELSKRVYAEVISIDEIYKSLDVCNKREKTEAHQAINFAESDFLRQHTSVHHFSKLRRAEKISYLAAVSSIRNYYYQDGQPARMIGFHLLFYKLLPLLTAMQPLGRKGTQIDFNDQRKM